jgi:hypothetical protein
MLSRCAGVADMVRLERGADQRRHVGRQERPGMASPLEFDLGQVAERLGCRYLIATGLTAAELTGIGRLGLFIKIYALEDGPQGPGLEQPEDPAISTLRLGRCAGLAACGPMLAPEVPAVWWLGGFADAAQLVQAARTIAGARNIAADLILAEVPAATPDMTDAPGNDGLSGALQEILGATHILDFAARAHRHAAVVLPRLGPGPQARTAISCRLAIARGDLSAATSLADTMATGPANRSRGGALRGAIATRRLSSVLAQTDPVADLMGNLLARAHRRPRVDPRIETILHDGSSAIGARLVLALHLAHVEGATEAVAALPQATQDGSDATGGWPVALWKDFAAALPEDPHLRVSVATGLSARGFQHGARQILDLVLATPGIAASGLFEVGKALDVLGEPGRAAEAYRQALILQPDHAAAHNNLAMLLFLGGDFRTAWVHHEWRFAAKGLVRQALPGSRLRTSDVTDASILVLGEQGIGDHIQFARYARALYARGNRIIFAVRDDLVGFLGAQEFVATAIGNGHPMPACDAHIDLLSLGWLFDAPSADPPACAAPYIGVDPERLEAWRRRLAHMPAPRVAIAWAGNPLHYNDRNRSIPADAILEALGRVPLQFISLQKNLPSGLRLPGNFADVGGALHDLMDAAAVIRLCDLVVSVDTAMAHLAGALGQPVWVLLPRPCDWRWMREGSTTPWYPQARLFRQERPGDWSGVLKAVAATLPAIGSRRE